MAGGFPEEVICQVETEKDDIDEILYRRHTGAQSGVGQSQWDDVAKSNFVNRTGQELKKFDRQEPIISANTMNNYVHSPRFSPSPHHLTATWDVLAEFIVISLNAV